MTTIALILGGASGIGAAAARLLAEDGFSIAVADENADAARAVAQSLPGEGHVAYPVDAAAEASIAGLFGSAEAALGPISVLVVAAAISGLVDGQRPTIRATPTEAWDQVMAVNARGAFLSVREMLRSREKTPVQDARIILFASLAAQTLSSNAAAAYVASKGAVLALTRVAAAEAAPLGVTVNAIAPGAVDTPMLRRSISENEDAARFGATVPGRVGRPEEIAAVVRFLASPASSYVNGACFDVNGGLFMR